MDNTNYNLKFQLPGSGVADPTFDRAAGSDGLCSNPKITVIIPTLNEERNLHHVLLGIPEFVDEVLIVDGHSSDNTVVTARELYPSARILYQDGKGKGNAIKCGIREAAGDIIAIIDADGSMDPREIPGFIEPLLKGYDFAKGSRFLKSSGTSDMPLYRRLANGVFVILVNLLYRTKYTDLCYGYNLLWKNSFRKMDLRSEGFEIETEMNIEAATNCLRVIEVPSFEHKRITGEGKLRSIRDGWKILRVILMKRITGKSSGR